MTFRVDDVHRDFQANRPIGRPSAGLVAEGIVVDDADFVAEKTGWGCACVRNERLGRREFQLERIAQERRELLLDRLGFVPWPTEPEQKVG